MAHDSRTELQQFSEAVETADLDRIRDMLDANPELWHAELSHADTCLHIAAKGDYKMLATMLAIPNVSVNRQTKSGSTPLHQAYRAAQWQNVDLLLHSNADPNARTTKARYPPTYNLVAWLHRSCTLRRGGPDVHCCTSLDRDMCYSALQCERFSLLLDPEGSGDKQWRIRQPVAYDCSTDASVETHMCPRFFETPDMFQSLLSELGLTQLQQTLDTMGQPQKLPYYNNVQEILHALTAHDSNRLELMQGRGVFLVNDFPMAPRWDLPQNSKFLVTHMPMHPEFEEVAVSEKWSRIKWKKNGIDALKAPYPNLHRQNATVASMTANAYSLVDVKQNATAPMFVHVYMSEKAGISKPKSDEAKQRLAQKSKRRRTSNPSLNDVFESSFIDMNNLHLGTPPEA